MIRVDTRRQRYVKRMEIAKTIPFSLCCVNFQKDANIAYVVRTAACFGAFEVNLIGSMPNRDMMNDLSGSTYDYINFKKFSTPEEFVSYCHVENIKIVAFELPDENFDVCELSDFRFDFNNRYCLVVGSETSGVPTEILAAADYRIYIAMIGIGHCLNTSQTANIAAFEIAKQWKEHNE